MKKYSVSSLQQLELSQHHLVFRMLGMKEVFIGLTVQRSAKMIHDTSKRLS